MCKKSKIKGVDLMMSHKQFVLGRAILLGSFGLAITLFSASSSKAQEASPDHFTDTGVQNVYENAPAARVKVNATGSQKRLLSSQIRNRQNVLLASDKKHARSPKRVVVQ